MTINCKLNKVYWDTARKKVITLVSVNWRFGLKYTGRNDWCVEPVPNFFLFQHPLHCCGISEIDFTPLRVAEETVENRKDFPEIVASYIQATRRPKDKRIVIAGIPRKFKKDSGFRRRFFVKLTKVLKSFGFVELSANPYLNKNSKNHVTILIGQF